MMSFEIRIHFSKMQVLLIILLKHISSLEINHANNVHLNANEKQFADLADFLYSLEIYTEYMELTIIGQKAQMHNVTLHEIILGDLHLVPFNDSAVKGLAVDVVISQLNITMESLNVGAALKYQDQYMCLKDLTLHLVIDLQTDDDNLITSLSIPTNLLTAKCGKVESNNSLLKLSKGFIPTVLKTMINDDLNPMLENLVGQLNETMQQILIYGNNNELLNTDAFDLRKSSVVDAISYFLNKVLAPKTGKLSINSLFQRFTENTNVLDLYSILRSIGINDKISSSSSIDNVGDFSFNLHSLSLKGLDTFSDFSFLSPKNGHTFDNSISIKDIDISVSFDFSIMLAGSIADSNGYWLFQKDTVNIVLNDNSAKCQIQAVIPNGAGRDYTDAQCLNMDCIGSLFTNETKINSIGVDLTLSNFNIDNEPLNKTIDVNESERLETKLYGAIINFTQTILDDYYDTIMVYLWAFSIPAINKNIYNSINNVSCKYIPDEDYNDFTLWTTLTAIAVSVGLTLIICLFMFCPSRKNMKKYQESERESEDSAKMEYEGNQSESQNGNVEIEDSSDQSGNQAERAITSDSEPTEAQEKKESKDDESGKMTIKKVGFIAYFFRKDDQSSLLMDKALPFWVRILFPFLIFLNIALFVSSNTGIGASVFFKFTVSPDKIVSMPSMFDFGLVSTIKNMWKAHSYGLSIIVALFSCVWPYAKLIMMLIIWIFPVCIMKRSVRERFLKVLDALGKWSLADSFVMVLMLIAYHLNIALPIQNKEVKQPFEINLWVYPAYGFITLCIGTIYSLALSHIMLALVRRVDKILEEKNEKSKNYKSLFKFCHNEFLKYFVILVILITLGTLIGGIILKTFSFEFVGLIGWAINLLDHKNKQEYSVINLAFDLPPACENPNSFTVRFTQVLFFLVSILLPIIHVLLLFVLWIVPLTKKIQIGLFKACEILYAWSCLDVFVVSVLLTIAEISQFSRFMVGDRCDAINPIISKYFGHEEIIEGHETCFDVITVLRSGSWLLIVAAVMHNVATIIVTIVTRKALEKRDEVDAAKNDYQSENENIDDESENESQYL